MVPPRHAVVLSVDEKSQIQALDRTQPGLPIKPGRCATLTHDYKRNGTTTLFAALNTLAGTVFGRCAPRHRHQEFIAFLDQAEDAVPAGTVIHAIMDNYATHRHPEVVAWLADNPRWTFHFTPTSCSWLKAVEGFFSKLTRQALRRGTFRSVDDLVATIARYIDTANDDPKPFVWTASATSIKAKLKMNHTNESEHQVPSHAPPRPDRRGSPGPGRDLTFRRPLLTIHVPDPRADHPPPHVPHLVATDVGQILGGGSLQSAGQALRVRVGDDGQQKADGGAPVLLAAQERGIVQHGPPVALRGSPGCDASWVSQPAKG